MAFTDVVILLPGITGSVLANKRGKEVWSPTVGSIWRAVTSGGGSIRDLELAADGDAGAVTAPKLVSDATIIPGFKKIEGYTRIEEYLVSQLGLERGRNYFPFPYDWRLDNRVNARRLEQQALDWLKKWRDSSGAADAKLVLIGHSMGGLVSRYFLEYLGGWQHTRTLITLGTPHNGALNAVDFLVHGMKKGVGPLGLDLSPLLRSFPSVYQLLPIYRCVQSGADLLHVADAADAGVLPHVRAEWARQARAFHQEIEDAQATNARESRYEEDGYRLVPLVGIEQPTLQSARVGNGKVEMLRNLYGNDDGGDGTVPRVSATPIELDGSNLEVFAAEMHGSLQNAASTLANLRGILVKPKTQISRLRSEWLPTTLTLDLEDVVLPGEPLTVRARAGQGNPPIDVEIANAETGEVIRETLARAPGDGWKFAEFDLAPGTWKVCVSAPAAAPVTDFAVVATP